jgi:two-component sensor histidine kinase
MASPAHQARIDRTPRAPAEARRMVEALPLDPATAEAVRLVGSELVSNAVMHGSGSITVTLTTEPGGVRVSVSDDGAGFRRATEPTMPPPDAPGGRGLALVSRLSARWGVEPGDPTRVWCVIPVSR